MEKWNQFISWLVRSDLVKGKPWKVQGMKFMTWAAQVFHTAMDQYPDGPCLEPVVIKRRMQVSDTLERENNVYSATRDLGFYDPDDFRCGLELVDENDPESLLLAKEMEEMTEVEMVIRPAVNPAATVTISETVFGLVTSVQVTGLGVMIPKSRSAAFMGSNRSRPRRRPLVAKLDSSYREFCAIARFQERKERLARRAMRS